MSNWFSFSSEYLSSSAATLLSVSHRGPTLVSIVVFISEPHVGQFAHCLRPVLLFNWLFSHNGFFLHIWPFFLNQ
jgi:hypothetical protein